MYSFILTRFVTCFLFRVVCKHCIICKIRVDIQGTSLHYFIYMFILQASIIFATNWINGHVFIVSFLGEMIYLATLVGLFLRANILFSVLSMLQITKSWIFCSWFFCQKKLVKKNHIALTNTCVKKDVLFLCTNSLTNTCVKKDVLFCEQTH